MVIMLQQLGMGNLVCKLRKQVDASDAKPNQSRLQLTYQLARGLLESGDLTDGEKRLIHGGGGDNDLSKKKKKSSGLKLDGYDRHGRRYGPMRFGRVGSVDGKNGNGLYRLKSFGRFVAANGLRAGHTVVAWVFRLPPPPPPEEEEEEDAPARLAVMLLDYPSCDPEMVEAMVEWEDEASKKFGAASGIVKISNAGN
uniref:Uncharacterized protein n=1 Tax=Oryza nivara TaxID=4536 RepID=A0A0E0G1U0_ORYNI